MNEGSRRQSRLYVLLFWECSLFHSLWSFFDVFCEVTGLNGKIELKATNDNNIEIEMGESLSSICFYNNEQMPWAFRPQKTALR